jgi:hypothetical protein
MPNSRKIIHLPENTSTGIYFVRIQTENQNLVKKLWLENKENK